MSILDENPYDLPLDDPALVCAQLSQWPTPVVQWVAERYRAEAEAIMRAAQRTPPRRSHPREAGLVLANRQIERRAFDLMEALVPDRRAQGRWLSKLVYAQIAVDEVRDRFIQSRRQGTPRGTDRGATGRGAGLLPRVPQP